MQVAPEDRLFDTIKRYLLTDHGTLLSKSSRQELYLSLCKALREEIMFYWTASALSLEKKQPRTIYYLSME